MGYIKHKGKKYTSILLKVSRSTDFSGILDEFHNIFLGGMDNKKLENIRYSLLELVNNSIRAHKEKEEDSDILIRFKADDGFIVITLKDRGGGFDKSRLPYDLDEEVNHIDINDDNFMAYRERHGYHRFGMGLLVTKRTFDGFALKFINPDDSLSDDYDKDRSVGTFIELRSRFT